MNSAMDFTTERVLEEEKCLIFNDFKHFDEVLNHISNIKSATKNLCDEELLEEELIKIFNFYQEQPHLLDPYLSKMISDCLDVVKTSSDQPRAFHFAFRLLYLMVKTRGYKSIIRLMPHTVDDIEPTLAMLTTQDINDANTWTTRYVLLLWLSILIMVPFGLECLDSPEGLPIVERILTQSKRYLSLDERTQEAASFLLARLVTRPDVVDVQLTAVIDWALGQLKECDYSMVRGQNLACGVLRSLANMCKIGRRKELLPHASRLLNSILELPRDKISGISIFRLEAKLLQRVGLLFCPPRSTSWQYQRGCRSLADNLAPRISEQQQQSKMDTDSTGTDCSVLTDTLKQKMTMECETNANELMNGEELELEYADEVAEVIDRLINALRSQYTVVRWSAAKGLGRMCGRLNVSMVNDVLSAILVLCTRLEPYTAWHGACLALAELGRRSLLLPDKLPEVIPVILRALFYDERSGDHSYGSNVRDAACYVCWAFARAYRSSDFAPYVNQVSQALVLVSLFDREVNVRRAAAAAFQENVGRQGQFPHGIDILTACDYFAVRNRTTCFLKLSAFVAQFPEYTQAMVDHLASKLLGHWDVGIRFLAARALSVLCPFTRDHMIHSILPQLIRCSTEAALYARQGNIFGTAELVQALGKDSIDSENLTKIKEIVPTLSERNQFRGLSGELLRKAVCHLIEKSSETGLPIHGEPIIEIWRLFLDDCVASKEAEIQKAAVNAYSRFLAAYLFDKEGKLQLNYRDALFEHFVSQLAVNSESKLSGYLQVLGTAPAELFTGHVTRVLELVIATSRITRKTQSWGDARRSALRALVDIIQTLGHNHPELNASVLLSLGSVFLQALSDYTLDSRGDIGSHVREVGMECLHDYLSFMVSSAHTAMALNGALVEEIMVSIAQQAVEKIDRTRAVAARSFARILHHEPQIPHIPHLEILKQIFPKEECDTMLWGAEQQTFPKFIKLLDLPEFRFHLVLGLTVSVGGLTETTVLCSTDALTSHLLAHESDQTFIMDFLTTVLRISESFSNEERIILPLFKFLDFILNDPVISANVRNDCSILLRLVENTWNETRRSKDVHRIKAAVDVFGGMLQFDSPVRQRACNLMMRLLCHRYPVIRKCTATKLYECLVVFEWIEPDVMDQLVALLTETIWESEISVIRPVRNHICELLDLPIPSSVSVKSPEGTATPNGLTSTAISVNGDASDRA